MKKSVQEILKNLVECNTIKDKENSKIIDYIEGELKELNFKTIKKDKVLIMTNKEKSGIGCCCRKNRRCMTK